MTDYKATLEAELETIVVELKTIAVQDQNSGDWVAKPAAVSAEADSNVSADTTEDWNERRAMVAQLETRYHNVLIALKKFELGTYGICEVSGDPIEADRLVANPAARTNKLNMERERELPF
jgi:RNA polymerase-binding transcription factor DksA